MLSRPNPAAVFSLCFSVRLPVCFPVRLSLPFALPLLAPLLVLAVAGCVLTPLHKSDRGLAVPQALAAIQVEVIADREGVFLRRRLRTLLYANGQAAPRWQLTVRLAEERRSFSIGLDETASRARVRLTAHWTLTPLANQTSAFAAETRTSFAYDIVSSAYATELAEEAARDAALEELAERLVQDLSLRLDELNTG